MENKENRREKPVSTKGKRIRILLGFLILGLGISLSSPVTSLALQLPVFKLVVPEVERERAVSILTNLHKGRLSPGAEEKDRVKVFIYRAGKKELEIYKASGGIFIRDVEQLWNPRLKPTLPSQDEAKRLADKFLADNKLLPGPDPHVKVSFSGYSETAGAAVDDLGKAEKKKVLDVQVNYKVDLSVEGTEGQRHTLPVVGGGGKFKVVIGQGDSVIGYLGVWRPIAEVASREEILPQAEAEAKFKKMVGNLKVTKTESFLAYYSAPIFEEQTYLAPVWVVKTEAEIGGKKVPLRNTIIAATKYGPKWPEIPAIKRTQEDKPLPRALDKDEHVGPQRESLLDLLAQPAWAQDGIIEAATSWIGPSQGLYGSPANAQGFVDGLSAAGWTINFNWGEANAWESDWNSNDDNWVDAADFVFYTGHADENSWVLNSPADTSLRYTEVGLTPGSPHDHYGQNDLEWVIIAACGPHESSHFTTGVGNAFDRWRGIFDGLHVFMGYGAVTSDNTTEGARVVELALAGWPIIDAWFRTAWEIQDSTNGWSAPYGPTIYVTAMYAHRGDHATRNDHIWGTGTTVVDPVSPGQERYLMWSGT